MKVKFSPNVIKVDGKTYKIVKVGPIQVSGQADWVGVDDLEGVDTYRGERVIVLRPIKVEKTHSTKRPVKTTTKYPW